MITIEKDIGRFGWINKPLFEKYLHNRLCTRPASTAAICLRAALPRLAKTWISVLRFADRD